MVKSLLALLLVFAVSLFFVRPRSVLAQAQTPHSDSSAEKPLAESPAKPNADLKAVFDSELRTMKNRSLTSADLVRIEKDSQTPKPKSEFTNKQKILWTLFIVSMAGLVVVLIKHPCREKKPGDCDFVYDDTY
jgi:hypothetical protein